jgi:sulfite exporter TauE/SafE
MFLLAALSLGFLGSFHCIGMCGPIAMAIPVKRNSMFSILGGTLVYNVGRVITYACIGLIFGILGKGFVIAGLQSLLSILLGTGILLLLFIPNLSTASSHIGLVVNLIGKLKYRMRDLFGIHTMCSLFVIGLLNGLLPCGLVYLGTAGALATGGIMKGALFMIGFGIGTLPTMLSMTFIRDFVSLRFRNGIRKIIPLFITAMAVLLILRGMNLGIPYISPSAVVNTSTGMKCHMCCRPIR